MGIKRIELYDFSDHAVEQMESRFKTKRSGWKNWLINFNENAELTRNQKDGCQLWTSGEVGMVINPAQKVIVTVMHVFGNDFPDRLRKDLDGVAEDLHKEADTDLLEQAKVIGTHLNYGKLTIDDVKDTTEMLDNVWADYVAYTDGLTALTSYAE